MLPGKTSTMSKFQKSHVMRELKTKRARNVQTPKALSQEKIKANLAQLEAHFGSAGKDAGQKMAEIVADMHPTVKGVYQLMQDQTKTIVGAIDARADSIDERLKNQDSTLANLAMGVERTSRLLMGHALPEDQSGMSNRELLAQNCQAVRSLQNHNIQLRAESVAQQKAQKLEVKAKKLEAQAQKKANKVQKTIVKPTI